jgi:hypothetical protein
MVKMLHSAHFSRAEEGTMGIEAIAIRKPCDSPQAGE